MIAPRFRSLIASILVLLLVGAWVASRWDVTTDISQFLPQGEHREQGRILQAVSRGVGSRTIVVTIAAEDRAGAVEVSHLLEAELRADAELMEATEFIEAGPAEGIDETLWSLLEPRRLSYVARDEAEARARVSDQGLTHALEALKRRLASPMSTFVARVAPSDPFLAIPTLFEQMQTRRADALEIQDGRFIAEDRYAVVFLGSHASALDAPAQRAVMRAIEAAGARVVQRHPGTGPLESSALGKFSIRAEAMIRGDIQRTTIISAVGLTGLCLLVFGSLRLVLLAALPLGCAMVAATALSLALFDQIHGLTFAFGASLFGVCIDYAVHLYVHHTASPDPGGPSGTLRRIWPALLVGATTTIVGFAVMAGSSFPGLRQVAIFAAAGIAAALISTRTMLPALLPEAVVPRRVFRVLGERLARGFAALQRRRIVGWTLGVVAVVVSGMGVVAVQWDDDLQRLQQIDPELLAEEEKVRDRVARFDQSRFVVAVGDTEQEALERNDIVADLLAQAVDAGEIEAWQSVAPILRSAARQEAVANVLRNDPDLPHRLRQALDGAGFDASLFEPFFEHLREPAPSPLLFAQLAGSPAATLVRSMRLELDGRIAFLSLLRDVHAPDRLSARFEAVPGAFYVDQTTLMAQAMRAYRQRTAVLLGIGLLAVTGILGFRYRDARIVVAAFLPAILAVGVTLAVLAVVQLPLNLIGLTAILMVLTIGVDYGVFLAEMHSNSTAHDLSVTLVALVLCWSTTLLGFGALVLSAHPAMHMIGIVAGVGVTSSLILAPMTFALLPSKDVS